MEYDFQPIESSAPSSAQQEPFNKDDFKPNKYDFQPIQEQSNLVSDKPIEESPSQILGSTGNSNLASIPAAVTAGISNFGASVGESTLDAGIWAANHLGMSDETANKLKGAVTKGADTFRTKANPEGNIFEKAVSEHPIIAGTSEYVPDAVMLAKTAAGNVVNSGGIGAAALNTSVRTGVNALVSSGISSTDKASQDNAATFAAFMTPAIDATSSLIQKGAVALNLPNKVKQYLEPIYNRIKSAAGLTIEDVALQSEAANTSAAVLQNNANYQEIKELPGKINSVPIRRSAMQLMEDTGSTVEQEGNQMMWNHSGSSLSEKQIKTLQGIQQEAGRINNMEDAVMLRQQIAAGKSLFQGQGVTKIAYNSYIDLLKQVDDQIGEMAKNNGLGDAFTAANKFNQFVVQPLYESGAVDRAAAVSKKQAQEVYNASQAPGSVQASIPPEYAQAAKQIFQGNMTPQKVGEVLSRMGNGAGRQALEDKFVQESFKDIMSNPDNFNKNQALMKLNEITQKYKGVLSSQSLKTFEGMKVMLKQAGAVAESSGHSPTYLQHYAGHAIGGAILGGALGGYEGRDIGETSTGGSLGALAGGVLGIAGGPVIARAFKTGLADTALGQAILRHFVNNPNAARQIITSGAQAYVTETHK